MLDTETYGTLKMGQRSNTPSHIGTCQIKCITYLYSSMLCLVSNKLPSF